MELLYTPSSPSSNTSTDTIASLNDPGASSEGDSAVNASGIDECATEEPSRDSILSLLGMRYLPTTHVPSSLTSPTHGQSTHGASPGSTTSIATSLSSFLTPSPSTPSSCMGLPTSFSSAVMSGMSSFPCYSASLLSPSSSSPPAVYTPPSPTMPSASGYQQQHNYHHHQHPAQQSMQYQPHQQLSSSYQQMPMHSSQLLYPQQHHHHHQQQQLYQQQPHVLSHQPYQQEYLLHHQQQQHQQHRQGFGLPISSHSPLYIQAQLNHDHHSSESQSGTKRKADAALLDSALSLSYQPLNSGGDLHGREQEEYNQHQHHHYPNPPQQQLVVAAKAKKRRVRKTWTERFQQLKEFKQRFGHCKVPKGWSEDPKLARWVCNMRQSKRMGKMKDERVRKLDELGFLWRCEQTGKVIWEEMIDKLKAFQAHHGHCRVPVEWSEDPQLSAWVVYVRQRHRANNLSLEKVKELDSINFVWVDLTSTPGPASAGGASNNMSGGQRKGDGFESEPDGVEELQH